MLTDLNGVLKASDNLEIASAGEFQVMWFRQPDSSRSNLEVMISIGISTAIAWRLLYPQPNIHVKLTATR